MTQGYDNHFPIYLQIMDEMKICIASGQLKPGEKLSSVRDLAVRFCVNPNTMQKALIELERENLIFTERTSGKFITSDGGLIMKIRDKMAEEMIELFLKKMEKLGYNKEAVVSQIQTMPSEVAVNG